MDGFQFIIESPQDTQIQKKRPRLVTSCDSCRLKKIKCLQPTPEGQCEACTIAKIPCLFRDRERYFAERNRSMAGPTGSTSHAGPLGKVGAHDLSPLGAGSPVENYPGQHTQVSSANAQPAPHSTQRSYSPPEISYDSGTNSRSQCYGSGESPKCSTMPRYSPTEEHTRHRSSVSMSQGYERHTNQSSPYRLPQLFEITQPQLPLRSWMPQFIQLFINHMGAQCPFLTHEDLYDRWRRQTMSPLMANCIASLGARVSEIPEVVARGAQVVADTYCENARELLAATLNQPTIETLHCIMLLAWAEYKGSRLHGFRNYADLAMRTAIAIGLSEQSLQLSPYEPYQNRLRLTWSSVHQMQLYASSV